jgi:hypothetical protein
VNPLVLRGITDLAKMPTYRTPCQALTALGEPTRHPFDVQTANRLFTAHKRLLGLQLRLRQLPGHESDPLHLPRPYAVEPQEQIDEDK